MRKIYLFLLAAIFAVSAQAQYRSVAEFSGTWNQGTMWQGGVAPAQIIGGNKNPDIFITETSFVTVDDAVGGGNLSIDGLTLYVNDYLVIEGSLNIGNNANLQIGPNGKLIVFGNFTSSNQVDIVSGGVFIVKGEFDMLGAEKHGSFDNSGELFLNDPSPVIKGAANGSEQDFGNLQDKYPNLYNFVMGNSPTPLPITLVFFTAKRAPNGVNVSWTVVKEWDFSHYELERAGEDLKFELLATIDAPENSVGHKDYTHVDENPLNGKNYYRLKAVDIDGRFEYKGVVMAEAFVNGEIKVFPNPCAGEKIKVLVPEVVKGSKISVINHLGQSMVKQEVGAMTTEVDLTGLAAGTYIVRYQSGSYTTNVRLIIQ